MSARQAGLSPTEAGELVYGPVTLNNWLSVSSQLLRNERNFGDLALSDIGTSMEVSIVNTIESLSESGVIQERLNDSGDVCVAVEDNLNQNDYLQHAIRASESLFRYEICSKNWEKYDFL